MNVSVVIAVVIVVGTDETDKLVAIAVVVCSDVAEVVFVGVLSN